MQSLDSHCFFCSNPFLNSRRRILFRLLQEDKISQFLKIVWPDLWNERLKSVGETPSSYICQICFQIVDTGSNRLQSLKKSIEKLEDGFSRSRYFPQHLTIATKFRLTIESDTNTADDRTDKSTNITPVPRFPSEYQCYYGIYVTIIIITCNRLFKIL